MDELKFNQKILDTNQRRYLEWQRRQLIESRKNFKRTRLTRDNRRKRILKISLVLGLALAIPVASKLSHDSLQKDAISYANIDGKNIQYVFEERKEEMGSLAILNTQIQGFENERTLKDKYNYIVNDNTYRAGIQNEYWYYETGMIAGDILDAYNNSNDDIFVILYIVNNRLNSYHHDKHINEIVQSLARSAIKTSDPKIKIFRNCETLNDYLVKFGMNEDNWGKYAKMIIDSYDVKKDPNALEGPLDKESLLKALYNSCSEYIEYIKEIEDRKGRVQ